MKRLLKLDKTIWMGILSVVGLVALAVMLQLSLQPAAKSAAGGIKGYCAEKANAGTLFCHLMEGK